MSVEGCPECNFDSLEVNKTTEDNEVVESGLYCPDCGTTFDEDTVLHWDDIDFPVWVSYESYDDTYGLWRNFLYHTNLYDGDYNGALARDMKYTVFTVYFKITEDGSVEGPYDERRGELL